MTQGERVLAALRRAGDRGVTAYEFSGPTVLDGGPRVMRVAARVLELRDQGHSIEVAGRRNGHVVYRLVAPRPIVASPPRGDSLRLFDPPPTAPLPHYKDAA